MTTDNESIAIKIEGVSKSFKLPHEQSSGVKQLLVHKLKGKRGFEKQDVLSSVSFEIKKGDFFGIVGRNGSGKSTLLKLMAGIYMPDRGSISVNGTLVPFIELGVGFNPELTGRENVYLNGALLGFSNSDMNFMYDEIVEFAELERFMDQKLKNYSSGMQVRLAFSIAIRANADILVLDEVLAVGDEAFQRKCEDFFNRIKKDKSKTIILVTHSMENVRKYCNRAMLIQSGEVKMIGNPDKIADEYYGINLVSSSQPETTGKAASKISAVITGKHLLSPNDNLEVEIKYRAINKEPVLAKAYLDFNGLAIMATNPRLLGLEDMTTKDTMEHIATYSLPLKDFNEGEYKFIALLEDINTRANIASYGYDGETIIKINNPDKSSSGGLLANQANMSLKK